MDYSFLRFTTDFNYALANENLPIVNIVQNTYAQLATDETFLQITNCDFGIAFAGNYNAQLITSDGTVVMTLAENTQIAIEEIVDKNGINQLVVEFGNIGKDFGYEPLILKISHTVSDLVVYSAPFVVTNDRLRETTRFFYKNLGYYKGISYDRLDFYQVIRLRCFDNDMDYKVNEGSYITSLGAEISYKSVLTKIVKGYMTTCNNFSFERIMVMFSHDILYINGFRTSSKPTTKKGDRQGTSNMFNLTYEYNPTETYLDITSQLMIPPITDPDFDFNDFNGNDFLTQL